MHAGRENLISWYLSIQQSNLRTRYTVTIVRISRSFLWNTMNDLMHEMQLWFLGYLEWSFQPPLKKKKNDHFNHLPKLNYGCKIECLQLKMLNLIKTWLFPNLSSRCQGILDYACVGIESRWHVRILTHELEF